MRTLFPLVLLSFIACSCATPYQPAGFRGGYSDLQLDGDTFRVSFRGNGYTSSETVETYLFYRCAEVTAQRGFDYFVIVDSKGEANQMSYTTGSFSTYGGSGSFSSTSIPINKHRAAVIIKLFRGAKPNIPGAFVARELMRNLRAQLVGLSQVGDVPATPAAEPESASGQKP